MRPSVSMLLFLAFGILCTQVACDQSSIEEGQSQKFYRIELGKDVFNVPTEYLLHEKNRKNGHQRYVITAAKIPDLSPIEDALSYKRPPDSTEDTISFDLNYGDGKKAQPDSLLRDWAANPKNSTVVIPDRYTKDGLIHLGTYKPTGDEWTQDIYAIITKKEPIAQIACERREHREFPTCRVYQRYRDYMGVIVEFHTSQIDWYAQEGMQKILDKVESWRLHIEANK